MKTITFTILFAILLTPLAFCETKVEYYPNGMKKVEIFLKAKPGEPVIVHYYENGNKKRISYEEPPNGTPLDKEFYETGELSAIVLEFDYDKNNGIILERKKYHKDGTLLTIYETGRAGNGIVKYYHSNGHLKTEEITFNYNLKEKKEYNEKGELIHHQKYLIKQDFLGPFMLLILSLMILAVIQYLRDLIKRKKMSN